MQYHNTLVAQRKCHALSCREVGALVHRSPDTITSYERGNHQPSLEIALGLQFVFGVPVSDLFPGLYQAIVHSRFPAMSEFRDALEGQSGKVADRKRRFFDALSDRYDRITNAA